MSHATTSHRLALLGLACLVQALQGVVIGQGQQLDAAPVGARDHLGGREHAVGCGAVAVQIDLHGASFVNKVVCYYAATSRFWLPP